MNIRAEVESIAPGLLGDAAETRSRRLPLAPGAVLLRGRALTAEEKSWPRSAGSSHAAPFRHMVTPGGYRMSVAMTNCGAAGWVTDRTGYRYDAIDPESGGRWPPMPSIFADLAAEAAAEAGFDGFVPDACLINRYEPGAKLSLHQDRNEKDFGAPIVSVSLGLPAVFLFGGLKRTERPRAGFPSTTAISSCGAVLPGSSITV